MNHVSGYKTVKNGRLMFCCTCASCGIKKYRFVMKKGNLLARDEADTIAGSALPDMFVTRGYLVWEKKQLRWAGVNLIKLLHL